MNIKRITSAVALTFAVVLAAPALAAADSKTTLVTPSDTQGWNFYQEVPTGSGSFVEGPEMPPLGTGSAQLSVDSTGRQLLLNNDYAGTSLSNITELEYSTYRQSGNDPLAISLQLDVDTDSTDDITAWQGRLVYEPYFTNTVVAETWQTWDTLATEGTGNWWSSGAPGNTVCPQSNPCTWAEIQTAFPNASIRVNNATDTAGFINFKAGGPWTPGLVGNVDAFTIGVNDEVTAYDFEAATPKPVKATTKEECKDGGWKTFQTEYKNQGRCVSSVASNGKAKGDPKQETSLVSKIRNIFSL